ncbi:hypothetical protein GCM10022631_01920 [Deinococcus rubellus]|uniref:Uncharacterized protein n=1 Tax=Deinococcus rubellus TaxID=1889240 RepID=A0ABY5YI77_9DEIO|nr:hypothetical protein [Deinococcus rubellus]UWX64774.1 hypothetical protein N0D28_03685 [Deinococcus rubellus]
MTVHPHSIYPDEYRFLSVLCGLPTAPVRALLLAELIDDPGRRGPVIRLSDAHRSLLRLCTREHGTARDTGGATGGLVLTELGETKLEDFARQYGVIPRTARQAAEAAARRKARTEPTDEQERRADLRYLAWIETQIRNAERSPVPDAKRVATLKQDAELLRKKRE